MTTLPHVECRILAGLHQGARAALAPDAEAHRVGRDANADIVLRDLPMSEGQIVLQAQSWTWRDTEFDLTMAFGEALDLDGVVIQVCLSGERWPGAPEAAKTHVRRAGMRTADSLEENLSTTATEQDIPQDAAATTGFVPSGAIRRGPARRLAAAGMVAVLVLLLTGAGIVVGLEHRDDRQRPDATPAETPATTAPPATANANAALEAIDALIDEMELAERVEAELNPSTGKIEISGVMAGDQEFEDFVRALRKKGHRAALRLITQSEFAAEAQAIQHELPEGVSIAAKPVGAVVLSGTVDNDEARESVIGQVQALLPLVAEIYVEVKTRAELAHQNRPRKSADVAQVLPRVMAVVSGPEPFLVLPGGERVLIGGRVNGLTLAGISDTHIDYQSSDGKLIHAPR